jgi:deoxycytidylate deaminase
MKPCKRLRVQAVGIDKSFSFVYAENGNKRECTGEPGKCGCIHSEINLLDKMPNPMVVILSHSPCLNCAKALHKAHVQHILYKSQYRKTEGIQYLVSHNIKIDQI